MTTKLNISEWGPALWQSLHAISFAYPDTPSPSDQSAYYNFFTALQYVIPCVKCRGHYATMLAESPIRLESREALARWLVDRHNEVNVRTGKATLRYEDVRDDHLEPQTDSSCALPWWTWIIIASVFVTLVVCIILIAKKR